MKRKTGYYCKGNIMTPLNWGTAIIEISLMPTAALQHSNWLGIASFVTAFLFIIAYIAIYLLILKKDPDRLQSEEFNLHQQEILIENGPLSIPNNHQIIEAQTNVLIEKKD